MILGSAVLTATLLLPSRDVRDLVGKSDERFEEPGEIAGHREAPRVHADGGGVHKDAEVPGEPREPSARLHEGASTPEDEGSPPFAGTARVLPRLAPEEVPAALRTLRDRAHAPDDARLEVLQGLYPYSLKGPQRQLVMAGVLAAVRADPDPRVRSMAAHNLYDMPEDDAFQCVLTAALRDQDGTVRGIALALLKKAASEGYVEALRLRIKIAEVPLADEEDLQEMIRRRREQALSTAQALAGSGDPHVRAAAAAAVADLSSSLESPRDE